MTLTSDSPASVVSSRALSLALENTPVDPPSGLSFVAEPGFTLTGAVGDLETLTISGQDFGTKAPPRHFDRIDRYWANGTEYPSPYGSISDGDVLKVGSGYPFLGTQGADLSGWRFRAEAARHGRALGYQIESDASGAMEGNGIGYTNDGFAGWPRAQRDSEEVYLRWWRFQRYFGTDAGVNPAMALASGLIAGATRATVDVSNPEIADGDMEEFYIELDSGELHHCIQQSPAVSDTVFDFSPALPGPASAGNKVYMIKIAVNKHARMQDEGIANGNYNAWTFSGFNGEISNDKYVLLPGRPRARWEAGVWELHEVYVKAPKDQASSAEGLVKFARINGEIRLHREGSNLIVGAQGSDGALQDPAVDGWPSSGLSVTLFGYEEDRTHRIPGNKYRVSDVYVDNSRRRVEIGIGNDDLYQCAKRECCPISSWNMSIEVKLNALPFTEAELAQARIFVVDESDAATLVGRIQ